MDFFVSRKDAKNAKNCKKRQNEGYQQKRNNHKWLTLFYSFAFFASLREILILGGVDLLLGRRDTQVAELLAGILF